MSAPAASTPPVAPRHPLVEAAMRLLALPQGPPTLPHGDASQVRIFRAAPAFLAYRTVMVLLGAALPLAVASVVLLGLSLAQLEGPQVLLRWLAALFLLLALVQTALAVLLVRVDFSLRYYLVTDRSLRIREGVLQVRELTLSFENVQNVAVEQGPVERLLGIANLTLDTAGGGSSGAQTQGLSSVAGHRGVLRGVSNAPQLRELILRRLERYAHGAGLGDDALPEERGFSRAEVEALRALAQETKQLARQLSDEG
jgi:membrane protein YdbS with pleckstrin-like domain